MLHICCQLAGKDSELEETTCLSELLNPVVCSYAYRNFPRVLVMVESCTKMTYMGNTWGTRCIQIWRLAAHKESDFIAIPFRNISRYLSFTSSPVILILGVDLP